MTEAIEAIAETEPKGARRAGPVGRLLRLLLAGFLILTVAPHYLTASWQSNLKIAASIAGLLIFYTALHLVVSRYVPRLNRWLGALLAITPASILFLLGGGIGQMGALTYIGGSLFIDSLNADIGCEVMAIPGLLCSDRTHLACIVFSPFDWLEQKITG
jgi:hypothetical protein